VTSAPDGTHIRSITEILSISRDYGKKLCRKFPCLIDSASGTRCIICSKLIKRSIRETGFVCSDCRTHPPPFSALYSLAPYTVHVKKIIHRLKYERNYRVGKCLGAQLTIHLASTAPFLISEKSVILPVPITFRKQVIRGFNQVAVMGKTVSRLTLMKFSQRAIRRIATPSGQTGKSERERAILVKGVFRINSLNPCGLENIILLDDVGTTLSTLRECSREIICSTRGKIKVYGLTVARSI
jgi:ComF family protein